MSAEFNADISYLDSNIFCNVTSCSLVDGLSTFRGNEIHQSSGLSSKKMFELIKMNCQHSYREIDCYNLISNFDIKAICCMYYVLPMGCPELWKFALVTPLHEAICQSWGFFCCCMLMHVDLILPLHLGFEVFTAVTMKNAVFWYVAPCRLQTATTC
jgi:hypothetical protein